MYYLTEKVIRSGDFLRHAYLVKNFMSVRKSICNGLGREGLATIQGGIGVLFRLAGSMLRLDFEEKGFYTSHTFSGRGGRFQFASSILIL